MSIFDGYIEKMIVVMGRDHSRGKKKRSLPTNRLSGSHEYPERLRKTDCIYVQGEIALSCRGKHKVSLSNGMTAVATASKMDHRKVGLMIGDSVLVEIPALGLSPNGNINGRIVWRYKVSKG